MNDTDLAYAAGIIDGEGSINVQRRVNKNGQFNYGITVEVKITDRDTVLWFLATFGGRERKPQTRNTKWRTTYSWFCSGPFAAGFLKQILPYLKIKRLRATYGIQLGENTFSRINRKGKRGFYYLTAEQRKMREEWAFAIRKENCNSNLVQSQSKWGTN